VKTFLRNYILLILQALFLFFSVINARAQSLQDTLETVAIVGAKDSLTDRRNVFSSGQQLVRIEDRYKNLYQTQSVANLLSQQTSVFVKAYGINSMATLSFRGASSAQSSVLWNGVPVLNPALGVADVSLLGAGLFDDITVRYGSSAALYGSGNVGGVLQLDNAKTDFTPARKLKILGGAGSYGRQDISLNALFQNRRWSIDLRVFSQSAKNDFSYIDNKDTARVTENARLKAGGGIISVDYNLSRNTMINDHTISFKLWLQQYNRQIPAALFERLSVKEQQDASLRSLLSWERKWSGRMLLYAKASFNKERLQYKDGVALPDNRNTVDQYYQEIGWKWRIDDASAAKQVGKHTLLVLLPLQYSTVHGDNLDTMHSQFRPAVAIAYNFSTNNDRLKVSLALRQEWANNNKVPLLPGAGCNYSIFKVDNEETDYALSLRANVQRTYRIPTLNELYYFPGGNPDLKPEQGWSQDAGYTFTWGRHAGMSDSDYGWTLTHDVAVFNRNIKDWIYWLGGAIWTPHNIAAVHSRGLETDNKLEFTRAGLKLYLSLRTAYTLSTSEASYLPDDKSKGKQIPYAPRYNGQGNIGLEYRGFLINYNHTYTGYRFVTIDESQYLQPYTLGNIQIAYSLIIKDYLIQVSAHLQNMWNKDYKVVWERPMPRRYALLNLTLGLSK